MGHQGAQQEFAVNPIRLCSPRSLLDRNAGRIEDKISDPGCFQQPMQPKAVIAGFIATHERWQPQRNRYERRSRLRCCARKTWPG
jgi:hypothetical protein